MNCPACGRPVTEGKAYCENPACGAVLSPGQRPAQSTVPPNKYVAVKVNLPLTKLVVVLVGAAIFVLIFLWMKPLG